MSKLPEEIKDKLPGLVNFIGAISLLLDVAEPSVRSPEFTPYVFRRSGKPGSSAPDIFNRIYRQRAISILVAKIGEIEPELANVAKNLYGASDNIYSTERKCQKCELYYEPLPEDEGICVSCLLRG